MLRGSRAVNLACASEVMCGFRKLGGPSMIRHNRIPQTTRPFFPHRSPHPPAWRVDLPPAEILVDGLQNLVRRQTRQHLVGSEYPANDAIAVEQYRRRSGDVLAIGAGMSMNQAACPGKPEFAVGNDLQVRVGVLGLFAQVDSFCRSHHHTSIAPSKILVAAVELNQLDHAERSPPATKKDENGVLIALEVSLSKRRTIGTLRLKRRKGLADFERTGISREAGG